MVAMATCFGWLSSRCRPLSRPLALFVSVSVPPFERGGYGESSRVDSIFTSAKMNSARPPRGIHCPASVSNSLVTFNPPIPPDVCPSQAFVKCHFDYDPSQDNLIPCKEAGLSFCSGDILQIFNQEDLNWWQVITSLSRLQ